jgi:hypothetical protein
MAPTMNAKITEPTGRPNVWPSRLVRSTTADGDADRSTGAVGAAIEPPHLLKEHLKNAEVDRDTSKYTVSPVRFPVGRESHASGRGIRLPLAHAIPI